VPACHRTRQQAAYRTKEEFNAVAGKLKPGDDVVFESWTRAIPRSINLVGGTL